MLGGNIAEVTELGVPVTGLVKEDVEEDGEDHRDKAECVKKDDDQDVADALELPHQTAQSPRQGGAAPDGSVSVRPPRRPGRRGEAGDGAGSGDHVRTSAGEHRTVGEQGVNTKQMDPFMAIRNFI